MKTKLLLLTILAFLTAMLLAFSFGDTVYHSNHQSSSLKDKKQVIKCGPDWESLEKYFEEVSIPPIPGAGSYKWKINTASDSAQFYFNQGINMYYAFHIIEGMASFKKAANFDPNAAMLYWAQALAYGPNINDLGYAASPEALAATNRAIELSANATVKEKLLISAMQSRYSADSTISRADLNQRYVDNLKKIYEKYPADPDVAALYADALMLQHPWDLWNIDGTPKPWTPLIRQVLEKLLARTPNHPGANHYYIHVMEPSPYFAKAIPSADRLGKLTPGLSHTVHMPSHIYLRTGNYTQGVKVNENAVNSYKQIIPIYPGVVSNDFLYIIHNLHMQTNNSMHAGRQAYSIQSANDTRNSVPASYLEIPGALGNYVQYIYMTPTLVDVRFGRWDEILKLPAPDSKLIYANVLYQFGKGMAHASQGRLPEARLSLKEMEQLMRDTTLTIPMTPFSAAIEGSMVAHQVLTGTIYLKEKKYTEATQAFEKAVKTEEKMVYNEPRDWMLNPLQWLGNALMEDGQFSKAELFFTKDLQNNNENVWSLKGLYQSKILQKKKDAPAVMLRFNKAAKNADIKITRAVL